MKETKPVNKKHLNPYLFSVIKWKVTWVSDCRTFISAEFHSSELILTNIFPVILPSHNELTYLKHGGEIKKVARSLQHAK